MKKLTVHICIIASYVILTSSGGSPKQPWEKENVSFPMINQEIRHAVLEDERQKRLLEVKAINAANEALSKNQWNTYYETKRKIQDRLRVIDFALQAIPTGYAITLEAQKIKKNQENIFKELNDAPYAIIQALPAQIKFGDDLQMVLRFIAGVVVSYGAINQMERAERQILLNFALEEVTQLERDSSYILMNIRVLKETIRLKKLTLQGYVNQDVAIVKSILNKVKNL